MLYEKVLALLRTFSSELLTPKHGFNTASKMKRRSVDVIFLCRLEKFEKYLLVNWGIIIEYIYKHYIKQISKNTEALCNIQKVLLIKGD